MFRKKLTFREISHKILDIYVSAALWLSSKNCRKNSPLLSRSLELLHQFVSLISPTSHRSSIDSMKSGQIQGGEEDGGGRPRHEDEVPPKDADAMMSVDPVGDSGDAGCREGVCIPFKKQSKK